MALKHEDRINAELRALTEEVRRWRLTTQRAWTLPEPATPMPARITTHAPPVEVPANRSRRRSR